MELKTMLYEKQGDIAIMTFNRPKVMNALDYDACLDILSCVAELKRDDEVKAAILTGGPKVFAAGGDIPFLKTVTPVQMEKWIEMTHTAFNGLESVDKPIVAAIAGLAFGGGLEVALACDIRIAAEGTLVGLPETNLALFPAGGGTQRVTRMAGLAWAKDLILVGDPISVAEAKSIGLITRIVPAESLMDEAIKLAKKLAAKAPLTTRITKQSLNNSVYQDLASGLLFEQKGFAFLFATEDHIEGLDAFMQKRKPVFKGN